MKNQKLTPISFKDEITVSMLLWQKPGKDIFRKHSEWMVANPNREEICYVMMEQGPAFGDWDDFDYYPFRERALSGKDLRSTDTIVNISKKIAGYLVEKTMLASAAEYYLRVLHRCTSNSARKNLILLQHVINRDPELQELPTELMDAMNELFVE